MKFSIIVPIYNVEIWLDDCLKSIATQKYNDYEVLLIDDGSTDNSGIIARKYTELYSNFFYYKKDNGGLSDARNYGIMRAKGEYLIFVDSDDTLQEKCLQELNDVITKYSNIDVIEYNANIIYNCVSKKFNCIYSSSNGPMSGLNYMKMNISKKCIIAPAWLKCVNRSFLLENKLFFKIGRIHEDELWTPQLYLKSQSIIYIDKLLYNYRIRENSIMQKKDKSNSIETIKRNCLELYDIYNNLCIPKKEIRVLYDYLARQYMRRWSIDKKFKKREKDDFIFILKNVKTLKTTIKFIIFCINVNLYKKISNL